MTSAAELHLELLWWAPYGYHPWELQACRSSSLRPECLALRRSHPPRTAHVPPFLSPHPSDSWDEALGRHSIYVVLSVALPLRAQAGLMCVARAGGLLRIEPVGAVHCQQQMAVACTMAKGGCRTHPTLSLTPLSFGTLYDMYLHGVGPSSWCAPFSWSILHSSFSPLPL